MRAGLLHKQSMQRHRLCVTKAVLRLVRLAALSPCMQRRWGEVHTAGSSAAAGLDDSLPKM